MSDEQGQLLLGVSAGLIDFSSRDELARLSLAMAAQCTRQLDIVSRHLDPAIYDNDEFSEAVKRLALSHRYARVRLLIIDSAPLVRSGHRLIELATRLSSFIEVRAPARQHKGFNEARLLADKLGYVQRQFSDRYEGQADFSDRRRASGFSDSFEEMWERAIPDTRFRRLHI